MLLRDGSYTVTRKDKDHFILNDTTLNNVLAINSLDHWFEYEDIISWDIIPNVTVSTEQGSKELSYHGHTYLPGLLNKGKTIYIEFLGEHRSVSITRNSMIYTSTSPHNLSNGDYVVGSNDGIYYARFVSTVTFTLHDTYEHAMSDSDKVIIDDVVITAVQFGSIWQPTLREFKEANTLIVDDGAPMTSLNNARIIIGTSIRPVMDGDILHRTFDGGVALLPSSSPDCRVIRQTRKYITYQSGKGVQLSKSVNFNAPFDITSITRVGSTATITTPNPHRLSSGILIELIGVGDWQGDFTIIQVINSKQFTVQLDGDYNSLGSIAQEHYTGCVKTWTNSKLRAGIFDDQNGMFFEYDGDKIYAAKRNSVDVVPGPCDITQGSCRVICNNNHSSRYTLSLIPEDMIVIKGMSYKVTCVANDSVFFIQPPYYGETTTSAIIHKTIDYKVEQSRWSLDVCNGSGITNFDLDIRKIQMIYIDYSWYGAGKVRYGFKGANGEVRYVHEFIHNNRITESFIKSGSLPSRYECTSDGIPTYIPALVHWGTSVIMDGGYDRDNSYRFSVSTPQLDWYGSDSVTIDNIQGYQQGPMIYDTTRCKLVPTWKIKCAVYSDCEFLKSGTPMRALEGLPDSVYSVGYPVASDDGSASGYFFIDTEPSSQTIVGLKAFSNDAIPNKLIPLASLRLSPSIHDGRPCSIGQGDIINRIQLQLQEFNVTTSHNCEIICLYNSSVACSALWDSVYKPSLCQIQYHNKTDMILESNADIVMRHTCMPGNTHLNVQNILPLCSSILPGNGTYPEGPDVFTLAVRIIDYKNASLQVPVSVNAHVSWFESEST
jgi:hypothetical protein